MSAIDSVCVFCGSRTGADPAFSRAAERFGRILTERGVQLVYGGGSIGLMGVLVQAVIAGGGKVTGVIPEFLMQREVGNPTLTELVVVDSMHERKARMFELADAFVILPGGIGTLDEAIEIITWKQLGLHGKPIAVLDVGGYWSALEALIERIIDGGFAHPEIRRLYSVTGDVESLLPILQSAPRIPGSVSGDKL